MKYAKLSPIQFRSEISAYSQFRLEYDYLLAPITVSILFDQVYVQPFATPSISLRNSAGYIQLSLIKSIKRSRKADGSCTYILECGDHSVSDEYIPVKYVLECA